ncbi:MAG: glycosyltransferase [Alphaproteobacteria bacterium]|nr:MAG: glycosyltransferase [Alphaproteobacteria bacterium]
MQPVAIGIFCKTPAAGHSKTRLSPPLRPDECARLSACFIRDLAATIGEAARDVSATGYAVYTPAGSEAGVRALLPPGFRLLPQCEGDFGTRLVTAMCELLAAGHAGAIMVNADSPTLPAGILRAAADATRRGGVVLSPALDGGYTLIGLSRMHARLFEDIPWSTSAVHQATVERAAEIGVPVVNVPGWYDVDDAETLALLQSELAGEPLPFAQAGLRGAAAPATRAYLAARAAPQRARSAR